MAATYTSERAWRFSVLPLGLLFILGGIVLIAGAIWMPSDELFVPPFQEPSLKRAVLAGLAIPVCMIGLGLCWRNKIAWYALFLYLVVGTIWHVVAGVFDPRFIALAIGSPVLNGAIAVGIYYATKPVFLCSDQGDAAM
jgi:hypothetical protein